MNNIAYKNGSIKLFHGNCLEVLPSLPENLVDTVITDPPYGININNKHGKLKWDYDIPGVEYWEALLRVTKPGGTLMSFGGTRTYHRIACAIEDAGWEIKENMIWLYGSGVSKGLSLERAIKDKTNDENLIRKWLGWHTTLKPAWEPIIVAIKPIENTFAQNALNHGVAGFNIDGCRIELNQSIPTPIKSNKVVDLFDEDNSNMPEKLSSIPSDRPESKGRWPANVIIDEETAKLVDEQSGILESGDGPVIRKGGLNVHTYGTFKNRKECVFYGDSGGASRFFYTSKASPTERSLGLPSGEDNIHPTVKPLDLMKYLCKLTMTPDKGTVLDCFMGSGTTGMACTAIGRGFIGIEQSQEYFETSKKRIEYMCQIHNDIFE